MDTRSAYFTGWDSIGHTELTIKIEEEFNYSFNTDEMLEMDSYSIDIEDIVEFIL